MKHLLWFVLISSAFGQIGTNGTTSNPVPVTCISGCSGGGSTTANQGTPNTFANAWPVELTDGTNLLGTPSFPVRTDPTGTTSQPVTGTVAVSNFPASQNVVVTSALPAGANVIGHVITDTGSTTAVTGNVTVIQGTGTNLHTVVDSGTTAISGTVTTAGAKTNNNAAPGATNLGVLPALANAATPSWSEGNQVALSTDLLGSLRTNASQTASVTAAWTNATAQNTAISVITLGYPTVLVTGIATSNTGQIAIEGSTDGGATYPYPINSVVFVQTNVQAVSSGGGIQAISSFNNGTAIITANSAGFTNVRVRLSAVLTSGTFTLSLQASASASQGPIPGGTFVLNTGVPVVNVTASNLNANVTQGTGTNLHTVVDSGTVTTVSTVSAARIVGSAGSTIDASLGAGTAPADGLGQLVRYVSTAPALTANQTVSEQADSAGTIFTRPYRRSQYKATASTITASTSPVTAVAAQGASIFADVTGFTVTVTTAATTATAFTITLSDGTANYVFDLDTGALATAAAAPTVLVVPFPSPLPATTANTAWTVTSSSATPTMHVVTNFVNNLAN